MSDSCKIKRWDLLKRELNNLKPEEFIPIVEQHPDYILIDCRTAGEFDHSRLEGALHMDYFSYDFLDKMEALDPEKTYLVYCRTGRRSVRTCMLMKNGGFKSVYNLDGGLVALKEYDPAII
jgi:rhodanese-related sulfurtransferase